MIQFKEWRKVAVRARIPFHAVVEPVLAQARARGDSRRGFAYLGRRTEYGVNVLCGWACGVRETHDGTSNQEKLTLDCRIAQLLVEQSEELPDISLSQRGHV